MEKIIKMDKKGLVFKNAFFALIIFSALIIAVGTWIGGWNVDYNSNFNSDLEEYNNLNTLSSEAQSQKEVIGIKSAKTDTSLDFEGTSIRGVFGMLSNIFTPFKLVFGQGGMIDSISKRFNLPDYIGKTLVALMIMAITFTLAAIFFRLPR